MYGDPDQVLWPYNLGSSWNMIKSSWSIGRVWRGQWHVDSQLVLFSGRQISTLSESLAKHRWRTRYPSASVWKAFLICGLYAVWLGLGKHCVLGWNRYIVGRQMGWIGLTWMPRALHTDAEGYLVREIPTVCPAFSKVRYLTPRDETGSDLRTHCLEFEGLMFSFWGHQLFNTLMREHRRHGLKETTLMFQGNNFLKRPSSDV